MDSLIKQKIEKYLKLEKETSEQILQALTLYIYEVDSQKNDLHILAKLLKEEDIIKLVSYFNGDILKIPLKDDYRRCKLLAASFFLKVIKGWEWHQIRKYLNIEDIDDTEFSSISLGKKINNIKDDMTLEFLKSLKNIDIEILQKFKKDLYV